MKKTTILQGLATVTILAGMAVPIMVQAQEGGQVPQTVKADFFQRASSNSIINAPNASVVTADDEAGSKYSFIAKFIKGVTTVETGGDGWTNDVFVHMPPQKWNGRIGLDVTKTKKGQSWIRYNNVGTADDGTPIDLKITIQDWEQYKSTNMVSNNIVAFNNVDAIATYQGGFSWVKQTWTYLVHGTNKEKPVSGYYSWIDVDNLQGMTIDKDSYKAIDKLYVPTKDTIVKYKEEKDGGKTFYDSDDIPLNDGDNRSDFTFLYSNRSRFDFTYSEDFATREKNQGYPLPPKNNNEYSYFGYSAKKPVRTAPLIPTKTVTDSDETNVHSNTLDGLGQVYTYTINHKVPDEMKEFYYSNYEMQDNLIPELKRVSDVKVIDETGKDVTKNFEAKHDGNLVRMVAKSEVLKTAAFYNHEYHFSFQTKIREGAILDKYLVDGKLQIPNQAKIIQNNKEVPSDKTHTTVTPKNPAISKKILEGDKEVDLSNVEIGDEVTFKLAVDVPNTKDMKSLAIEDDLEDVLNANKEVKVTLEDGTDITEQGKITVDEKTEKVTWTANEPNKLKEKRLFMYIKGTVKDTDFTAYHDEESDNYFVPNVAKLVIDSEPTDSNEVEVVIPPKKVEPKITKNIETDGKLSDFASAKIGDLVKFKLNVDVPNRMDLESVVISDDLEDVLDANKEVKVTLEDGTDITGQGTVAIDDKTEKVTWTANEPQKLRGKHLTVYVQGTLKDTDFTAYLDDKGNIMIPNVAQLIVNEKPYDSNKVNVTTPQEKPTILPNTGMDLGTGTLVAVISATSLMAVVYAVKRKKDSREG
ncbi:isopeptide-forming domain-containing fimbrial protein [Enterococcus faecalis]|nr:isopeptide-forming domain-containing fimbrial protein [Enterococcus faecalis]